MPDIALNPDDPHSVSAQRRAEWWEEHPPRCRYCYKATVLDETLSCASELAFRCTDPKCWLHSFVDLYARPEKEQADA